TKHKFWHGQVSLTRKHELIWKKICVHRAPKKLQCSVRSRKWSLKRTTKSSSSIRRQQGILYCCWMQHRPTTRNWHARPEKLQKACKTCCRVCAIRKKPMSCSSPCRKRLLFLKQLACRKT